MIRIYKSVIVLAISIMLVLTSFPLVPAYGGEPQHNTYVFNVDGKPVNTQKVLEGRYLYNPDSPADPAKNRIFAGWYDEDGNKVDFGEDGVKKKIGSADGFRAGANSTVEGEDNRLMSDFQ